MEPHATTLSLAAVLLGLSLGARHALEPDHLAAVSVLSAERPSPARGALLGAWWGAGHASALLLVALALAALSAAIPARLGLAFELGVAIMLVALGVRCIARAARRGSIGVKRTHRHARADAPHEHAGPAGHVHVGRWTLATRPLLVGMAHGLAGSGALTAIAAAELPTTLERVGFVALFGLGSVLGMAAISGLAGWPLARVSRTPGAARVVSIVAGSLSVGLGLMLGVPLALEVLG